MKAVRKKMKPVRTLEAIVKAPGEKPRVTVIANTLEAMQSIVGGHIEVVGFTNHNVIVCNEEGRMLGLPENAQGICGTMIVLGRGCGDGEFSDVVEVKYVLSLLREEPGAADDAARWASSRA